MDASPGQDVTTLSEGSTPQALVDTLLGGGLTVSNVAYTGSPLATGTFTGMDAIGFGSGIVLDTGEANEVVGPNEIEDNSTDFGLPGDSSLDTIVTPLETFDASVLEFDFVPAADTVRFEYVFGSEEYNNFVNTEFNDVFAFLVNGTNCATVPGTNPAQPVSINTVNGGNPVSPVPVDPSNPQFYRNNSNNDPGPATIDVELDGLTTVFTCEAKVNPNVTNTLKLAVADTADGDLDTAVFIQSKSLAVNVPPVCTNESLTVVGGQSLDITLVATDANPNDVLAYTIESNPTNGQITGTPPSITYHSNSDFSGTATFTFMVRDGELSVHWHGVESTVTRHRRLVAVVVTPTFTG